MERLKQRLLHKVRIPKGNTFSGKTRKKPSSQRKLEGSLVWLILALSGRKIMKILPRKCPLTEPLFKPDSRILSS